MIDYERLVKFKRFNKGEVIMVIPSLVMVDPDCYEIVKVIDDLKEIINVLSEYLRDII